MLEKLGLIIADIGKSVIAGERGDPIEVARALADVAVQLLPVEDLKPLLDEAARRRAELAADVAEDVKFPR